MEAMKGMPDNAYDLAIVDPEYGIGQDGRIDRPHEAIQKNGSKMKVRSNNHASKKWDDKPPPPEYFKELFRVSKNQIIWGGNYFSGILPPSMGWIVWDKVNGESDYSDCELAFTSFDRALRKVVFMWRGMMQGKSITEGHIMQGNKKLNEKRIHPTQKPVALYKWLLKNYAKEGDKILDTHGGSMSIAIACHDMKFDLDLWEIDEEYCNYGLKRFNQHISQTQLF
jgi:site-specific DNA-methyltransferase (adenine-specific)